MTELAKRYGGSLYDLAAEEQLTDQLLAELDVALDCFNQEPAYLRLLSTPGRTEERTLRSFLTMLLPKHTRTW